MHTPATSIQDISRKPGVRLVVEFSIDEGDARLVQSIDSDRPEVINDTLERSHVEDAARLLVKLDPHVRELSVGRGKGQPVLRLFSNGRCVLAVVVESGSSYSKSLQRTAGRILGVKFGSARG